MAQMVKNLPAIQETQVQSLGWEDPLQYSYPENSMDRGTWRATVHGISQVKILERVAIPFSRGSS